MSTSRPKRTRAQRRAAHRDTVEVAAAKAVMHAIVNGNVTPANDLVSGLGLETAVRSTVLRKWLVAFGPFKWVKGGKGENGKFALDRERQAELKKADRRAYVQMLRTEPFFKWKPQNDSERLVSRLAEMSCVDIMAIFHNALRIVADPNKSTLHRSARRTLADIDREWARRGKEAINPEEYFEWPSTEAPGGRGTLDIGGWPREGLLAFMGYRVGSTNGAPTHVRRAVLDAVFTGHLPPVFSPDYLDEWGQPGSAARLKKMAETIAALTRNAKRKRNLDTGDAIHDWEDDLRFLYETYYVRHFRFAWPSHELP